MADVASSMKDWSATAGSNQPDNSDAVGPNTLADNQRTIQAVVRAAVAGSDTIASATTCDIGAKDANYLAVSGTTTITGFGTVSAGIIKVLKFDDALTLTHHATSLILPTGANITTAAGDTAVMRSEGSGNWRCLSYSKKNGEPVQVPRMFVGSTTRDMTTASGTQAITGVGFQPTAVVFLATQGGAIEASVGFSASTNHKALHTYEGVIATTWNANADSSIFLQQTTNNYYAGTVSAYGADGFTITWTKTGSPTGTATVYFLAIR